MNFTQRYDLNKLAYPLGAAAVLAAMALIFFGAGPAGAAGKGRTLKYVGTSAKTPGGTMVLEGPRSPKAKKGAWPSPVTVTFRNATFVCDGGGGKQVMRKYTKTLSEYPMEVMPFGNGAHPHDPTFELNEEFGGGENSLEPENPEPETEVFFYGEFGPSGKTAHVAVKYSFAIKGSEIGSKEAEPICSLDADFKLKRQK
jgi:hypothetical protein